MAHDEFQKLSNDRFNEIMDVEAGQNKLESLNRMRARVNWEIEEERENFYWQLCRLINDWKSRLPNLREVFCKEEIDWLLTKCVKIGPNELIKFVIRTGYRDEPDLDEDGKPLLCRNTPILYAARHTIRDWISKVRELFKIYDKFNVNYTNESGLTHFHVACMCGCDEIVEKFLELGQDPNISMKETGDTSLHMALKNRHAKTIELLLRNGADPNWANKKGFTPIHIICRGGNDDDLFEKFFKIANEIKQTIQVDARDNSGRTPLHWAVHYGHMKLVDLLLRRGADVNSKDAKERSCLHFIGDVEVADDATEKFFEICEKIQLTVKVNTLDNCGRAPLHVALRNAKPKMFECLLRNGADPNIADAEGSTSLHLIALHGIDDLVEKFFEICNDMQLKVQVNALEKRSGRTPLQIAVRLDKRRVVESLLRNGADPNIPDVEEYTSLHAICSINYHDDLAEKFLQICDDKQLTIQVDAQSKLGWTPLYLALFKGKKKPAEWLLRKGVNPNLANKKGCTPLHAISCRKIDDDLAEWFFEICDDMNLMLQVDAKNNSGETALHLALYNGKERNIKELLRKGSNPNLTNTVGYHPLHMIASRPIDDELVEKFIKMCSDIQQTVQVNIPDKRGWTPLHYALLKSKKQNVKDLLRRGANPNTADKRGLLPLHIICNGRHDDDSVKLFFEIANDVQQTVQVDALDEWGLTPLDTAVGSLSPGVVDVLLDHGADLSDFAFPPDDYFCEMFDEYKSDWDKLKLASGILAVVECLEKRGYEMKGIDVLTIIKLFVEHESFENSSDLLEKCWYDEEEFTSKAKEIIIIPNLSLYDLIQLRPEEAAKLLTYTNYLEIERVNNLDRIPEKYRDKCLRHLCEKMSRRYFERLAIDAFQKLIHHRLPILCCDMIIENLKNEDLFRIYEAGEIIAQENKAKLFDAVEKGPVDQKVQINKWQRSSEMIN